eukprot:TRINITY_DN3922_c0_g2_i1.p1 TRINITY_DN3922_c0_g2~~TRINITY_DN3922_c0_g2_i1.p1  ORF type:complete len:441 (-),score=57.79 TRINITY_DN3922_c0_g2_i1:173-1495(-)
MTATETGADVRAVEDFSAAPSRPAVPASSETEREAVPTNSASSIKTPWSMCTPSPFILGLMETSQTSSGSTFDLAGNAGSDSIFSSTPDQLFASSTLASTFTSRAQPSSAAAARHVPVEAQSSSAAAARHVHVQAQPSSAAVPWYGYVEAQPSSAAAAQHVLVEAQPASAAAPWHGYVEAQPTSAAIAWHGYADAQQRSAAAAWLGPDTAWATSADAGSSAGAGASNSVISVADALEQGQRLLRDVHPEDIEVKSVLMNSETIIILQASCASPEWTLSSHALNLCRQLHLNVEEVLRTARDNMKGATRFVKVDQLKAIAVCPHKQTRYDLSFLSLAVTRIVHGLRLGQHMPVPKTGGIDFGRSVQDLVYRARVLLPEVVPQVVQPVPPAGAPVAPPMQHTSLPPATSAFAANGNVSIRERLQAAGRKQLAEIQLLGIPAS